VVHDLWRKHENFMERMDVLKLALLTAFRVGLVLHLSTDVLVRSLLFLHVSFACLCVCLSCCYFLMGCLATLQ